MKAGVVYPQIELGGDPGAVRAFAEAAEGFRSVEAQREGGDGPSRRYLAVCAGCLETEPDDEWSPALVVSK